MMRQRHPGKSRSIFHKNIDVFLLIDRNYFAETVESRSEYGAPILICPS